MKPDGASAGPINSGAGASELQAIERKAAAHAAIHRIFEQQAQHRAEAAALLWENGVLTYRELNQRANSLARFLRRRGVQKETLVGVCLRRSPQIVIAFLAILKAGGAYVPLDPEYPSDRLALMLADTAAPIVVTDRAGAKSLPRTAATMVLIDADERAIAAEADSNPNHAAGPQDLAYVMYTSGSTGQPKGVMIEHRGVLNLVRGADYVSFDEAHRFLLLAPTSFDASTFEIWGPLLNGASLVIAPPGLLSLERLAEVIQRHGVTTLWLAAGLFHLMVDQNLEGLRPIRQLIAGGDALSIVHCRRLLAAHSGCRLVNGYGPTETTTFAVCATLHPEQLAGDSVPIGLPINKTEIMILDENLHPVGNGDAGELCISGPGVARGYLNDPIQSRAKFIDFSAPGGQSTRLYRTGDQVRRRSDGLIEFLGRRDEQVKISGYRIEPNEIACALREYPGIHDATVIADKSGGGEPRLVAFMVGKAGALPDHDAVRAFLRAKLPVFMLPAAYFALDSVPLNNNGKIDRAALTAILRARAAAPGVEAPLARRPAPADDIEQRVAAVWSEVLDRSEIDPRANFFELGGDSLRLIEVHARLRKEFDSALSITDLFESPTIEALAARLRGKPQRAASDALERARRQKELLEQRARSRN